MGSVTVFGAMAPTSAPSSRPQRDEVTATRGLASRLQASLRITVLMTRSIRPWPSTGPRVPGRPVGSTVPGATEPAGGGDPAGVPSTSWVAGPGFPADPGG